MSKLSDAIDAARGGPLVGSSLPDPLGLRVRSETGRSDQPERLIVIGITGLARSGKDTIAGILCQRFGFTRVALADGLRSAFRDLDGPTWELTKGLESAGRTSRWALQQLGTEARRAANAPNLWIDLLATKIAYLSAIHPSPVRRFVVPDIRFLSEVNYLRSAFGGSYIWSVSRPGAGLRGEAASHASERELSAIEPDLKLFNGGSIAELETIVGTYASQLFSPEAA